MRELKQTVNAFASIKSRKYVNNDNHLPGCTFTALKINSEKVYKKNVGITFVSKLVPLGLYRHRGKPNSCCPFLDCRKTQWHNKFFLVICCWEMSFQTTDQSVFVLADAWGLHPDSFALCQSNSARAFHQANACQLKGATQKQNILPVWAIRNFKQEPSHYLWPI